MIFLLPLILLWPCYAALDGFSSSDDHQQPAVLPEKNIAIIGAGAAGSSAAYHLAQYACTVGIKANITVFERASHVGGRSTTVNAYEDAAEPVELGASIFVKANRILVSAARDLNLTAAKRRDFSRTTNGPDLGVWNGKQFVITQSASTGWWDITKLLWRYGWAPIRTQNLMKATIAKFLNMYEEPHFPWRSLSDVAYELGLTAITSATGEQFLKEKGVSALFANEIVQASTRVNYAQNLPYIHGLETMVCMAAEDAMSIPGGNWQIFDSMLRAASAVVKLDTTVSKLEKSDDGTWLLELKKSSASIWTSSKSSERFDSVIIAAPYQFTNLTISPSLSHEPDAVPYVQLHVTLFTSPHALSPSAFNLPNKAPVPAVVLTTLASDEYPERDGKSVGSPGFFSISTLRSVKNPHGAAAGRPEYLYKIFSAAPANATLLSRILGLSERKSSRFSRLFTPRKEMVDGISSDDITWIHRKVWDSYPYEYPRITFESLQLDTDLWYTGGMDSFISTMETNALMGKNIARLVADDWSSALRDKKGEAGLEAGSFKHENVHQEILRGDL